MLQKVQIKSGNVTLYPMSFLGRPLSCKHKDLALCYEVSVVCLCVTSVLWLTGKS